MRIIPNQDDMEERKEIWQWIKECIHECDLTPEKLSKTVGLSAGYIKRGIEGEPLGIRNAVFKFVKAFGLVDYRFEDENSE